MSCGEFKHFIVFSRDGYTENPYGEVVENCQILDTIKTLYSREKTLEMSIKRFPEYKHIGIEQYIPLFKG